MQGWLKDSQVHTSGTLMMDFLVIIVGGCISFGVVYGVIPPLISVLKKRGMHVRDVNKKSKTMVARPGGPAILAGILCGITTLYLGTGQWAILATMPTIGAACVIGYIDDLRVMPGWFKPALLVVAAMPLILFGQYSTDLEFPLFGTVNIPILYLGVILVIIPIMGNTINSIDVVNGVASGYMTMAGVVVAIVLALLGRWEAFGLSVILVGASLAFYRYHRLPSRIFPGDSGALILGATYGCIAIYGGVEVVAAVALLPAIANSFFFLYSVKRVVEHRQIKRSPVYHDDDMMLHDTGDPQAPITLVRLILRNGPQSEGGVARQILKLGVFAAFLAILSGIMMIV